MQGDVAHAARGVARVALRCHFGHDIRAVLNIGRLAERRISSTDIVMVTSEHYGTDFTVAHHFVEFKRDLKSTHRILIKDSRLCANNKSILFRIAYPPCNVIYRYL